MANAILNEWVEINLPWKLDHSYIKSPSYYGFDARAKKELGFDFKDCEKLRKSMPSVFDKKPKRYNNLLEEQNKIQEQLVKEFPDESIYSDYFLNLRMDRYSKSLNDDVRKVSEYRKMVDEHDAWLEKQPEIIKDRQRYEKELIEHAKKSFTGLKLNNPGTLIEIEENGETHQFLLGDVNTLGGTCDDCSALSIPIVKRYKIVWKQDINNE